jgi:hypothetical protein
VTYSYVFLSVICSLDVIKLSLMFTKNSVENKGEKEKVTSLVITTPEVSELLDKNKHLFYRVFYSFCRH